MQSGLHTSPRSHAPIVAGSGAGPAMFRASNHRLNPGSIRKFRVDPDTCRPARIRPAVRSLGFAGRTNASARTCSLLGICATYFRVSRMFLFPLCQNFDMYFYRRNLPHLQGDFKPHLITFVTKFRWVLPEWARDIVLLSCCHDHRRQYELYVAVVMPDHVHLILTPLIDERRSQVFSLIEIMRGIKGASGREINRRVGRHGAVWQEESFDHVLRCSEGLDAKVEYVLQNPVRKGLVDDWKKYRWAWQRSGPDQAKMTIREVKQNA